MTKIAICEDSCSLANELKGLVEQACIEQAVTYQVDLYFSGEKLLEDIRKENTFDIYILDIRLDQIDGIQLGKEIRRSPFGEKAILFYVSAYPYEYLFDMLNLHTYNFINKPVDPEEFKRKLQKALTPRKQLCLCDLSGINRNFEYSSIVSAESRNKNIIVCSMINNNPEEFTFRLKLSDLIKLLPSNRYIPPMEFYIHPVQSFVVNLHYVTSFSRNTLTLLNDPNRIINISRSKIDDIANQINNYANAVSNRMRV